MQTDPIPSTNQPLGRYAYLDGWRGLSILAVLIGHFFPITLINTGRLGVEMFFVLSGRLMAEILFVKKKDLLVFLKRRISRVWPALFVFIILISLVLSFSNGIFHVTWKSAFSALTFTYNDTQVFISRTPALDHIWSLCVEEHIYIMLAAIAFFSRKMSVNPLIPLGIFCIAFMANGIFQTWVLGRDYNHVYWRSDVRGASIIASTFIFLYLSATKVNIHYAFTILFLMAGVLLSFSFIPDQIKYSLGSILIGWVCVPCKIFPIDY